LGTLSIVFKMNCHPDRSVPGFPATLHLTGQRMRLSAFPNSWANADDRAQAYN
jgi:hypothetical protein